MLNSGDIVQAVLSRLDEFGDLSLKEAEVRLSEEFGFGDIDLLDAQLHPIHGRMLFRTALESATSIQIVCPLDSQPMSPPKRSRPAANIHYENDLPEIGNVNPALLDLESQAPDLESVIREFDRAETRQGPIWAGFLVKTLLPQMGYGPHESRELLQTLEAAKMIILTKRPNPKSPERPTTFVQLNRDHSKVRAALAGMSSDDVGNRMTPTRTRTSSPYEGTHRDRH